MSDAEFCGGRRRRRGGGGFWNPTGLFTGGEQGAWYDPSDLTTLFQNEAGTTPVTAVEQPVSLMLDKRLGLAVGAESLSNPGPNFPNTTGWSSSGSGDSFALVSGELRLTQGVAGNAALQTSISVVAGQYYEVFWAIRDGTTTGTFVIASTTGASGTIVFSSAAKSGTTRVAAGSGVTSLFFQIRTAAAGTAFITSMSVRPVAGNHAYTPSSASTSRPVLSARVNLLTATEEFDSATWLKTGATVMQNASIAPNGLQTADAVFETATTGLHIVRQDNFFTTVTGASYTASVYAKANGRNWCAIALTEVGIPLNAFAYFDLTNGVVGTIGSGAAAATIEAVGNGWYRCTMRAVATSAALGSDIIVYCASADNSASYAGDITKGILVWGADVRVTNDGVSLPPYQRVTTSTDYDTTGFPLYLRADGLDDYMLTSSIDFSGTDKMTVVAGMRKLSDAAAGVFTELSSNFNNNSGSFIITIPDGANTRVYTAVRGTSVGYNTAYYTDTAAPITNINSIAFDKALSVDEVLYIRKNGSSQALTRDLNQNTPGNFDNYPLYLFRRNGTTAPFNGRFYGLVVRGAATDTATIQQTEAFLNNKTRAY